MGRLTCKGNNFDIWGGSEQNVTSFWYKNLKIQGIYGFMNKNPWNKKNWVLHDVMTIIHDIMTQRIIFMNNEIYLKKSWMPILLWVMDMEPCRQVMEPSHWVCKSWHRCRWHSITYMRVRTCCDQKICIADIYSVYYVWHPRIHVMLCLLHLYGCTLSHKTIILSSCKHEINNWGNSKQYSPTR